MDTELPITKYHPDPIATGSVEARADAPCLCCNRIRGYIYVGPAYSAKFHYLSGSLCPWCVADGSAAKRFKAEFTDVGMLELPDPVLTELATCTPGFDGWQQEGWLTCCDDAAAYLGPHEEGDSTAYRFRCLHCAKELSYTDQS